MLSAETLKNNPKLGLNNVKIGLQGNNLFVCSEKHLSPECYIELSREVFSQEVGLQCVSAAELPLICGYNPQLHDSLSEAQVNLHDTSLKPGQRARSLAQLKTWQSFIGPLDEQIIHRPNTVTERWITEKATRLARLLQTLGGSSEVQHDGPQQPIVQARSIKLQALEGLRSLHLEPYDTERRSVATDPAQTDDRFGYSKGLRRQLGDNLVATIAYGGSIAATSPSEIKDYDTFVVVRDVALAYVQLEQFAAYHGGVPVHIQLAPAELAAPYLLSKYSPHFNQQHMRVIDGEVDVPVLKHEVLIEMGIHELCENVFNRRKTLLSRFIAAPYLLLDEVKRDSKSIALVEALTVVPLAQIGWLKHFMENPNEPRPPKRVAAARALHDAGLPEIPQAFMSAELLLRQASDKLSHDLARSVLDTSHVLLGFCNRHSLDLSGATIPRGLVQ